MFYKMIQRKRDEWYASDECTINEVIQYIVTTNKMRDAQIDAIKTYLFLKIACESKPLAELFSSGVFNSMDLDSIELSSTVRTYLENHRDAAALFEYASLKNDDDEQVSQKVVNAIKDNPESIDYESVFKQLFYGVSYTDYLFSLPMGAGKTYLMAAFIYLDIYFAINEPNNPVFAHNFIIFAPSGTKTSIIPSLKNIQRFDPTWVISDPAASDIKKMISFEVLDQAKSSNKSNKTKNPNVQKIANHQPLDELFGLVAVTNAEKVILDRIEEQQGQITWFEDSEDEQDRQANELRNLIGKLPNLSIFIDEVHHASSQAEKKNERKLRSVVNRWAQNGGVSAVLGFSGTPYLAKAEKFTIKEGLKLSSAEISNVVYYYPLIEGIGNFLKRPTVKIASMTDSAAIVEQGVREFLDNYKDTVYEGDLTAKLGIYCGTIEKCEELVYPLVSSIVAEYGMSADTILRFHGGNKNYPQPADSPLQFASLDQPFSRIRIVLLVQIGKEGWDCQSLTGIILSQEGDCPTNMVLQTSCRCLRQVGQSLPGTALVYLNDGNAEKLKKQLDEQHHMSIKEFETGETKKVIIKRYDRTKYLKLPNVDFYQLTVSFEDLIVERSNPSEIIPYASQNALQSQQSIQTTDFSLSEKNKQRTFVERKRSPFSITFHQWLYGISREGFGTPSYNELCEYKELEQLFFDDITIEEDGLRYFNPRFDISIVNANIRKAFVDKRDYETREELIPESSSLLNIKNFNEEISVSDESVFYPDQQMTENIVRDDKGELKMDPDIEKAIELLKDIGEKEKADQIAAKSASHPQKDKSFHYLPYRTDSSFEQKFLKEIIAFDDLDKHGLEVYYNGDRAMTEFKIKCYRKKGEKWDYIGLYTPDFLIIKRKDGEINKVVIVETKGRIYANDPTFKDKRTFMETEFAKKNNEAFGYKKFDYLYLEDTMPEEDRLAVTHQRIEEFFKEEN